jgi:hypothetical protein
MGCTACTEPQCLYKGSLYLTVELYLYSPYGPYDLYRASVSVQGCTLPCLKKGTNTTNSGKHYQSFRSCRGLRQAARHIPLFQSAFNRGPRVLLQCSDIIIRFPQTYLSKARKLFSFGSQTRVTSKKNKEALLLIESPKCSFLIVFSASIIATHFTIQYAPRIMAPSNPCRTHNTPHTSPWTKCHDT